MSLYVSSFAYMYIKVKVLSLIIYFSDKLATSNGYV